MAFDAFPVSLRGLINVVCLFFFARSIFTFNKSLRYLTYSGCWPCITFSNLNNTKLMEDFCLLEYISMASSNFNACDLL